MDTSQEAEARRTIMRLVRYADDFIVLVAGQRADAEQLRDELATVLAPMGLRLSEAKTRVCHIDEGSTFWDGVSSVAPGKAEPARRPSIPTHPNRACSQ